MRVRVRVSDLLEGVGGEVLEAEDVEDADDRGALGAARDVVDAVDDVVEERGVDHLGDMGEIWERYAGDMGEIWWRYGGDVWEIWGSVDHLCERIARLHRHLARELHLHGLAHHGHGLLGERVAQRSDLAAERRRGTHDGPLVGNLGQG